MENKIFSEQNVAKSYIKLSLPLVLSMVVTLIYNLADTYFIAQTNNTNLVAGVSLGAPIFTLLMAIGNIFGQGGTSLISRLLGQNDQHNIAKVSSFCFYTSIIVGIIMTAIMLIFRVPLLYLIGASTETFQYASDYYVYLAIGASVIILSYIHSNFLRAEGMSKESMCGTVLGSIVNIILDPILISILSLGASGAAIASVIGYLCSDIFFIVVVLKRSQVLSMNMKIMKISFEHISQIFGIGVPAAIVNVMQSVSAVLVNQFLLPYGNDKIAAMGIALKISMIALLLLTGFAFGGQPLFGYYYGSKDTKKFKELFKFCLCFMSVIGCILTISIYVFAPSLMKCFIDTPSIVQDGTTMLRYLVITMVFVGVVLLITIVFQSTGKALASLILSISRQGIVFLVVLMIMYHLMGYTGIIASQALSDVITAFIAVILFRWQIYPEIYKKQY
ncbi:MAG: MATE family efflux transporter [Erysipelotrichaceae bacterium]|nr:MATE family efflux transporter [Erysipelotrichaceae bacterium]